MSTFDPDEQELSDADKSETVDGSVEKDSDNFLHSLITGGDEEIEDGRLVAESLNQGITSFNPDTMFKHLVSDYKRAERLYGETIIKQISGYETDYIQKNMNIPEFKQALQDNIHERIETLEERDVLEDGEIGDKGIEISSVVMYLEELDKLTLQGGGESHKRRDDYGEPDTIRQFQHDDPYRNFALRKTLKQAIRRGHETIHANDMKAVEREREGRIAVTYAMDASGSMKGEKLSMAKRAGVALTHKAIEENNEVGLVVFGTGVKTSISPCQDKRTLLQTLTKTTPGRETNIADTIDKAVTELPDKAIAKHIVLLTDALPTKGSSPVNDTMEAVVNAVDRDVTISLVGIDLNEEGRDIAEQIVDEGNGRLYTVNTSENVDVIVLDDYQRVK